ncbi:Fungal transcriptional regulatory protein [Cordyceps javanica]|uniref:Fungal transcriptional regulatory protein n=1 Tax=Cordyceps javanica TaxID=43265 RepID=A0A545W8V5_9HYPO|nr:Fungal transcriptional regulatory protein [Cordyceps javanica]TQW10378.1 Fungal transcriptional regulatory protein [Cordyceps javanica]
MAEHLVQLARQYSNHLVEVLDEHTIQELLQTCYSNTSSQEPGSLCLLYLLFAAGSINMEAQNNPHPELGLVLSDTRQADEYFNFAEATLIRIGGYETFEVWMIQAWALMTIYSLAASKWHAADAYIGLAVRATDVLGINQVQGSSSRTQTEVKANAVYAKLWKCLFVLDSLVAALLGRQPQALKEEKCKPVALGDCSPQSPIGRDECLEFNVASAKVIRKTIKLVYNQKHFPFEKASSMLRQAQLYSPPSPVCFQEQVGADNLATQHAILIRNYALMLLSRPFLIHELYQSPKHKYDTIWENLSETCVVTAHQSIERIYEAHNQSRQFQNDYMWRPCLFTAVLVVLANQYFAYFEYPNSDGVISQAFTILEAWSARNPTEESELSSLFCLRRLVEERKRRSLPINRPDYLGMPAFGGYDVLGDARTNIVFPTHDFVAPACADSTYCSPDGRRYSVQSMPSSDYMESATSTGIAHMPTWSGAIPSTGLLRCGSDAGCYGFAVQQDGYEGDTMQVTQDYAAYPGQQIYLS